MENQKLTKKTRRFLSDQYNYKQVIDDPKKAVDLYFVYEQLWRKPETAGANKYATPFVQKYEKELKLILDFSVKNLSVLSSRFPVLDGAMPLIEMSKAYIDDLPNGKVELGKTLVKKDKGFLYKMLQQIPDLEASMNKIINDNPDTPFSSAAKENLKLIQEFKSSLDITTSDEELIAKAPENAIQALISDSIKESIERANNEGAENYEKILEEEIGKNSEKIDEINDKLTEYLNQVLSENLSQKKREEIAFQMNEARGWASIIAMVVGEKNQKLGNLINEGSKSILDSYEAFTLIANFGFTASTFATGIGGTLKAIKLLNAFGEEDQTDQIQILYDGLNKINENINLLRAQIEEINSNLIYLINQVEDLINHTKSKLDKIDNKLDILISKVDEYGKINLESDFIEVLNKIKKIRFDFADNPKNHFKFITSLTKLYDIGLIDATLPKFIRNKDSVLSNYEYLSLENITSYDSFKWSPIEERPFLIEKLRSSFLESEGAKSDIEFWKEHLPKIEDFLIEDFTLINPIIASEALLIYSEIIHNYYIYVSSDKEELYNKPILERINDFYDVFIWFNKSVCVLSSDKILKFALDDYIKNALELLENIHNINKANLYKFSAQKNIENNIQINAFLLNALTSKFETELGFTNIQFNQKVSFIKNFLTNSLNFEFSFNPISEYLISPPFWSNQKLFSNPDKVDKLNKHYDHFVNNLPENIDEFFYLMGNLLNEGLLKIEKEIYVGSLLVDLNHNYYKEPFWGELTIKYIISFDNSKTNLNQLNNEIIIQFTDTKLGLPTLHNTQISGGNFTATGTVYHFAKSLGNGSHSGYYEYATWIPFLPPSLFSEDLFLLIDSILMPDKISSIKDSLSELKAQGVYMSIGCEDKFSTKMTIGDNNLIPIIDKVRDSWINLATAILCHSESNQDTSIYFELLSRKPKLLETTVTTNDKNFVDYTIDENLSDLLLLWINREKDEKGERLPFEGINVRGGLKNQDTWDENITLPTIWFNFDEDDKVNPVSYELWKPYLNEMLKNIISPKNAKFYGSILPNVDKALLEIDKLFFYFYFKGIKRDKI